MRDVDHVGVRRDPLDDAVADADELVRDAIVGEQGYDRRDAASVTASTSPSTSRRSRLGDDAQSEPARLGGGHRSDRDAGEIDADRANALAAEAGGEHDEIGLGEALDRLLLGPAEDNHVGGQLARNHVARARSTGEEHAIAGLQPGAELPHEPLLRRLLCDQPRLDPALAQRLSVPGPTAATAGAAPSAAPPALPPGRS